MKHAARQSPIEQDDYRSHEEAMFDPRTGVASPARALQDRVHASFQDEPEVERWPVAVRTGFILLSAASLWAVPIALVNTIRHYYA